LYVLGGHLVAVVEPRVGVEVQRELVPVEGRDLLGQDRDEVGVPIVAQNR